MLVVDTIVIGARQAGLSLSRGDPDGYADRASLISHLEAYAGQLPDGGVLVVGAGATRQQLALELLAAGRRVVLAAGRHARIPRTYRGRDIYAWLAAVGKLSTHIDEVADRDRTAGHRASPSPARAEARRSGWTGSPRSGGASRAGWRASPGRTRCWTGPCTAIRATPTGACAARSPRSTPT